MVTPYCTEPLPHLARAMAPDRAFVSMPDAPPPQKCPTKQDDAMATKENLMNLFERRVPVEDSARVGTFVDTPTIRSKD